ncbi:hypothetical protein FLONG3_2108 [Fusarium longipes]|uniref:Uncharacterized protein n=1 Tax=Fusarium longipes TaxID=694270 RepID=A0A395T4X7_9HYPO|nr:hypothetical protein FLONG3_2108 [Fusarium longipes]
MSWLNRHPDLRDQDLDLLDFEPRPNEAFVVSLGRRPCQSKEDSKTRNDRIFATQTCRKAITDEVHLDQWLSELTDRQRQQGLSRDDADNHSSTMNLIMAAQMSSLDEIPFTQKAYTDIMSRMSMHGSIVRAINRNTHCSFSALSFDWPCNDSGIQSIGSWEGDMALSVTFFPETMTTNAVWYGCDIKKHRAYGHSLSNVDIITSRLSNFDGSCFHPLILPTMFAELERERHVSFVRRYMTQLVQRINDLAYPTTDERERSPDVSSEMSGNTQAADSNSIKKLKALLSRFHLGPRSEDKASSTGISSGSNTIYDNRRVDEQDEAEPAVVLWQNTSFLSNGLQNWQTQLRKMLQQVQELDDANFRIANIDENVQAKSKVTRLRETGIRIKIKIQDLIDEYDEHIRQCNHITEGLRLATQLELNQIGHRDARTNQEIARVNLKVAQMTRLDGSLMRSIATLGMIFLPATFVSTFFSMDFFQWSEQGIADHELISSYIWVYIVAAVGLTVLTMSIFYTCVLRAPSIEIDEESSCSQL